MSRGRAEILIGKALRDATEAALNRFELLGDMRVPEAQGMAVARAMARAWRYAIKRESLAVQRAVGEVKQSVDSLWQSFVDEYVRLYGAQAVTDILETTRQLLLRRIDDGLRQGKSVSEIAQEVREWIPSISRSRAMIISRTETHSAAQYASLQTAKRFPFKVLKVWSSSYDHRTRDFGEGDGKIDQANHRAMNGVSVPLDDPFMVPNKWGGFDPMMFPGDQTGPAYQCVNCRCAMTYKRAVTVIPG